LYRYAKVNKVVKEYEFREKKIEALERLWAKLRFPSGETRWARDCLNYHVKGSKELLEKEVKRLNALLRIESKATQAQITSAAGDLAKAEKEITRLQKMGYAYQVESTGLAVAVASERVNEFTAIQIALAAPVKVVLQVLDDSGKSALSVQCQIMVKPEVDEVERGATKIQSLLRTKLARKNFVKLKASFALGKAGEVGGLARERKAEQGARFKEEMSSKAGGSPRGPVNFQPIPGVGSGVGGGSGSGSPRPNTSGTDRANVEVEADEKNETAKNAREDRAKREMQQMNRAIAEIKVIYKELKFTDAEIAQKLQMFSTDDSGGGASVGAMLSTITEEIALAKSRMGVRDGIKMLQSKLPKLWKKNGMDGDVMLQRLAMAVTHPIDVKINVDAEMDVLALLGKSKKFYGNKKKLNMPEVANAILKHIASMAPLERQAVLVKDLAFVKMTESAEKVMKKAKKTKREMIDHLRTCANAGLGESKMEAVRKLIAATEAEMANQKRLKEEAAQAKKDAKKAGKGEKADDKMVAGVPGAEDALEEEEPDKDASESADDGDDDWDDGDDEGGGGDDAAEETEAEGGNETEAEDATDTEDEPGKPAAPKPAAPVLAPVSESPPVPPVPKPAPAVQAPVLEAPAATAPAAAPAADSPPAPGPVPEPAGGPAEVTAAAETEPTPAAPEEAAVTAAATTASSQETAAAAGGDGETNQPPPAAAAE
jgi:hypothetical protein